MPWKDSVCSNRWILQPEILHFIVLHGQSPSFIMIRKTARGSWWAAILFFFFFLTRKQPVCNLNVRNSIGHRGQRSEVSLGSRLVNMFSSACPVCSCSLGQSASTFCSWYLPHQGAVRQVSLQQCSSVFCIGPVTFPTCFQETEKPLSSQGWCRERLSRPAGGTHKVLLVSNRSSFIALSVKQKNRGLTTL